MTFIVRSRFLRCVLPVTLIIGCFTSISCSEFDSTAYAAQRERAAKPKFQDNAREFSRLAEEERERLRALQAEIEKSKELILYFEAYHAWLKSLSEEDREKILKAENDEQRLSVVRSIRKEQEIKLAEEQKRIENLAKKELELKEKSAELDAREREMRETRMRKNEMITRLMRVSPEDQIKVFEWLTAMVKKNREKLLESMPDEMSRRIRLLGGDELKETQLLVMALVNRKLTADPRFVTKEEFEQLRASLSHDACAKIDGLEDHNQRIFVLQQWGWSGYWAKNFAQVTPEQLETFRKKLNIGLQAALEKETPIEKDMHLRRLYARSQTLNVPPEKLDESGMGESFAFDPRVNGSSAEPPPRKGQPSVGGPPGGFRPGGPRPPRPGDFPGRPGEGPPPDEFGPGGPEGGPPPRGERPPRGEGGFDDRPRDDRLPPF